MMLQDLRFAFRRLRKTPGFTAISVLILALGIGTTTTLFTVVHGVLLKPLPYPGSERIVLLSEIERGTGEEKSVAYPTFVDWREMATSFETLAALRFDDFNITDALEPEQIRAARVSRGFFEVFATAPALGRTFADDENEASSEEVLILGHDLWQRQLGGRAGVVGESLRLDGEDHRIVGVMPEGFDFPGWADAWLPLGDLSTRGRDRRELTVVGRLARGSGLGAARAEMTTVGARIAEAHPETQENSGVVVRSLLDDVTKSVRGTMLTLFGAVAGVLLVACLNVAALQVVRGLERRRELAVRAALGAGRRRVLRQLLTESLTLAVAGGGLGVLLAYWGLDLMIRLAPQEIPRLAEVTIAPPVLAFAVFVTLATGVAFGLLPAARTLRFDLSTALRQGRGASRSGTRDHLRSALVVAQVALTLVLLAGAALLGKSFLKMLRVEPGFDVDKVVTLGLVLPPDVYPEAHQRARFLRDASERIEQVPGVAVAAAGNFLPFSMAGFGVEITPLRSGADQAPEQHTGLERVVTPGYFAALGMPIVAGRGFTPEDDADAPVAVVVNQSLARRVWPERSPVGERIVLRQRDEDVVATVVGVVGDVRHRALVEPPQPEIFRAHAQNPWSYMNLVVRADGVPPESLIPWVKEAITDLDPRRPLFSIVTMSERLRSELARPRFSAALLGVFSLFALLLAAVGIYGVMAYSVRQQSRDIGIRMALGARRANVHGMVIRQGMVLALVGLALGIAGALAATRLLEGLLYEVAATDVSTFVVVSIVTVAAAYLATHVPALRASRVDPMTILREE